MPVTATPVSIKKGSSNRVIKESYRLSCISAINYKKFSTKQLGGWLLSAWLCMFAGVTPSHAAENVSSENFTGTIVVEKILVGGGAELVEPEITLSGLYRQAAKERAAYPRAMTIEQLHLIADQLTLYVRSKGYLFHTVYLPPQKINNGLVYFAYQQATLTDIHIINKSDFSDALLEQPFQQFLGKPLYAEALNERVNALKNQGGLKVFAFYSRGQKPNTVRLNIRAESIPQNPLAVKLDNYGSDATGKLRATVEWQIARPLGRYDQLSLALLKSIDKADTTFGYINYDYVFSNLNNSLSFSAGNSQFQLGNDYAALAMTGDSRSYTLDFKRVLVQAPERKQELKLGVYQLQSSTESGLDSSLNNNEKSQGVSLGYKGRYNFKQGRVSYGLSLAKGNFTSERLTPSDDSAALQKINFNLGASYLTAPTSRLQTQWALNLRGQIASDPLPGIESVNFGGVYGVRAIDPSSYSGETGTIASLDIRLPALMPSKKNSFFKTMPYVFFDRADGKNYYTDTQYDSHISLSGWGVGMLFNWRSLSANIAYALPLSEQLSNSIAIEKYESDARWLFELRWH